ncbi:hypothetical protein cyc_07275 [Cyclospora cayetanensis]|uniref:Geranylgeranyl transferase type-2 subunit alpha n=1 Tax=Cyclospora cayetanensis TaxID=88456 RepID=A0A1D3D037_9EIME|nr:hypothetical protein cyc_07275 [Cyclospora cayetanensis]
MHGRRREDLPVLSPEKREAQRQKIRQAFALLQKLLTQRKSGIFAPEVLQGTRKLIEFHPELSTIWNYRREVLIRILEKPCEAAPEGLRAPTEEGYPDMPTSIESSSTPSSCFVPPSEVARNVTASESSSNSTQCFFCRRYSRLLQVLRDEMQITTNIITSGSAKAYCVWLHRSWTLARLAAHEFTRHSLHASAHPPSSPSPPDTLKRTVDEEEDLQLQDSPLEQPAHLLHTDQQPLKKEQDEQASVCGCCKALCPTVNPTPINPSARTCGLDAAVQLLQDEVNACERLLTEADCRNFHCWQHRATVLVWLAAFMRYRDRQRDGQEKESDCSSLFLSKRCTSPNAALSLLLIQSDFSNYSAWHLRSMLPEVQQNIKEELDRLWHALYTDPSDQSLWQYYNSLFTVSGLEAAGRLLSVRGASRVFPFTLLFFFSEPCLVSPEHSRIVPLGKKGSNAPVKPLKGRWIPMSTLYLARVSGCTARMSGRLSHLPSPVWNFVLPPDSSARDILKEPLRVHLALSQYGGFLADEGRGIDAFHLQRLKSFSPELAPIASLPAQRTYREPAEPLLSGASEIPHPAAEDSSDALSSASFLWKCHTIIPCTDSKRPSEAGKGPTELWAICHRLSCTGTGCGCSVVKEDAFKEQAAATADPEVTAFAEAVAAAGGCLPEYVSADLVKTEIERLEEFFEHESECAGGQLSKLEWMLLRFTRALSPHSCRRASSTSDVAMLDENYADTVRTETHTYLRSSEAESRPRHRSLTFFQHVWYPLLLEAVNVKELSLSSAAPPGSPTNTVMLDWHIPFLPYLRELHVCGTKISQLSLLLLSVAQLPCIYRVDATDTQLLPVNEDPALSEDEDLIEALGASTLQ